MSEKNVEIVEMKNDGNRKSITLKVGDELFENLVPQKAIGTGTVMNRYDPTTRMIFDPYTSTTTPYSTAIKLPTDPHEIIQLAMMLYFNDPIVGTVIDLMVDICGSGFENECEDENVKKFYDNWCKQINMDEVLQWIFLEFFRTGNVTVYKSMNDVKPTKKGRKSSKLSGKKFPTGYTVLNPLLVKIEGSLLFNSQIVSIKIPEELKRLVRKSNLTDEEKELLQLIPVEIIKGIRANKDTISLDQKLVSRITRKKQPYERYAIPAHHRCFEPCIYKQKLRKMDISTIEGLVNQLITVTIGNDEYPATDAQLKAIAELFKTPNKAYCWAAGTKILMADYTEKNIEDIEVGDEVITHLGNKTKVLSTHIRPQIGEGRKIKVLGQDRMLDMTWDHKLFAVKKYQSNINSVPKIQVLKAHELEIGDLLLKPLIKQTVDNYILVPITDIITYNSTDPAYGFFVEAEEHSYIANNIASKNTLFFNHTLQVRFHKPEGIETLNQEKYKQVNDDILMGLGITRVLLDGQGSNFSTAWVSILALLTRLERARHQVKRWLESEYEKIADDNGFFTYPTVRFDKLSLREDAYVKNVILALYDRGLLSAETVLTDTGYKVDVEAERKKDEKKELKDLFVPPQLPFSGKQPGPTNQGRPNSPGGDNNYTPRKVSSDPGGNQPKLKSAKGAISEDSLNTYINYYENELMSIYEQTKLKIKDIENNEEDEERKKQLIIITLITFASVLNSIGNYVIKEVFELSYTDISDNIADEAYTNAIGFLEQWHNEYSNKFAQDLNEKILSGDNIDDVFNRELYRVKMFAREGVLMADMKGKIASNKSIGKTKVTWKSALLTNTCAVCIERHNKVYDIDDVPMDHPNGHCWLEFLD